MKTLGGNLKYNLQKSVCGLLLFTLFFMLIPSQASALTDQQRLNELNRRIQEANRKLQNTRQEKRTLQGDIGYYNSKITTVQDQIDLTTYKISSLSNDITKTNQDIASTEKELAQTRTELAEYLRTTYEEGQISMIELIVGSKNFSDFVNKAEYLESIQIKIKDVTDQISNLKSTLENHRKKIIASKKQTETLYSQQAIYKSELSQQRSEKAYLLSVTKGNEAEYKAMISRIRTQIAAVEAAIWAKNNGGSFVSRGKVRKGDIIGYIGNTGYSTGCHLHFEIRTPTQASRNPLSYIGNGYYRAPVNGVRINVPYGYSSAYFPGIFHTGLDYADGCRGTPVRATADGDIVAKVSGRPNTFPWSLEYGNYVKIRHTNGWYSLYAHLR